MAEMNLNQTRLAECCHCAPRKINEIVNGKRGISPSFAITLESVLGTSAEMWVRMQADYLQAIAQCYPASVFERVNCKDLFRLR